MVIPINKHFPIVCKCISPLQCMLIKNAVVDMKSTLFKNSYVAFVIYCEDCCCLHLFTNILTLECILGHQGIGVCEVSDPHPLYIHYLRYLEKHIL